ncbi:LOW QUALITY PROTEIN: flap endonuclease GEN [Anthonomus grandis grandis]|uniref:LOW QUALITY PROTEIN: flap endonuclease GEN n=1 Tax=Anthonomus grandis grandis TaxID=2921223 RepID=UPI002166246C|nr:LOW QUALITY PROTEIN: flap endonuclease GEN [Anthonomus grandis grandis]
MGIKDLWTIFNPFCDKRPLYELQGKTVAIDLSGWICEAQTIREYQGQPSLYLRNLYFRTCCLLLLDVLPVFVLEGEAPMLKYDTIATRNAKQSKPKTRTRIKKDSNLFLNHCEDLLRHMGLACLKAKGEAESLCAALNEDGLVDGCISQDSDCFAYGAKKVYRNFSISTQGDHQSASGGSVDVYDIRTICDGLKGLLTNFGRNKIVAMALLLGCDYSPGVNGIGKESVLKFFDTLPDIQVFSRLRLWRTDAAKFNHYEEKLNNQNICITCGHEGKTNIHSRNGCVACKTKQGCTENAVHKMTRAAMKNEIFIRSRAIQDPNFPDQSIIDEFLKRKEEIKHLDLKWKQPNLVGFVKFTKRHLNWDEVYSVGKIVPLLTRWQLKHPNFFQLGNFKGYLVPKRIKKERCPRGVPSYEISWSDPDGFFKGIISDEQYKRKNVDREKLWSTVEPQPLVEAAFPELVDDYKKSKIKPKKPRRRRKISAKAVDAVTAQLGNISITEPVSNVDPSNELGAKKRIQFSFEPDKKKHKKNPQRDWSQLEEVQGIQHPDDLRDYLAYSDNLVKKAVQENPPQVSQGTRRKCQDNFLKQAVINSYATQLKEMQQTRRNLTETSDDGLLDQAAGVNYPIDNKRARKYDLWSNEQALQPSTSTEPTSDYNNASFDPNISSFGDEDDTNVTVLVDNILSRGCPVDFAAMEPDSLSSSFFIAEHQENDVFESTVNDFIYVSSDEEGEGELENLMLVSEHPTDEDDGLSNRSHESYCDYEYVPLHERLNPKVD